MSLIINTRLSKTRKGTNIKKKLKRPLKKKKGLK
jgi:hypothetical protein